MSTAAARGGAADTAARVPADPVGGEAGTGRSSLGHEVVQLLFGGWGLTSKGKGRPGDETAAGPAVQRGATGGAALRDERSASDGVQDGAAVHAQAARGVATPGSALPHTEMIQRSFGHHDISSVQAHTGAAAESSAHAMGADAYATGDHVVLGARTDLFTVAHEAAHVVQQRAGVHLKGGVGAEGDRYEQHADAVASLVVQNKSAESLLDAYAPPADQHAAGSSTPGPVQCRFQPDAMRGCYMDDETNDEYDVVNHVENVTLLTRRSDGLEVRIDAGSGLPMDENDAQRLRRLNRHPQQTMATFGDQALTSGHTDKTNAYRLYAAYQSPHPLPAADHAEYLDHLARIDKSSRPKISSHPQREDKFDDPLSTRRTIDKNPRQWPDHVLANSFYRAEATDPVLQEEETWARVALRLRPRHATTVFEYISTEMIGMLGIKSAKVAGPGAVSTRSDSVIIYLNNDSVEVARRVAEELSSRFPAEYFEDGVPVGMLELARGIGFAERHPDYRSHGNARSVAVERALRDLDTHRQRLLAQGITMDDAQAQQLLRTSFLPNALRSLGIDPSDPHLNLDNSDSYFSKE